MLLALEFKIQALLVEQILTLKFFQVIQLLLICLEMYFLETFLIS